MKISEEMLQRGRATVGVLEEHNLLDETPAVHGYRKAAQGLEDCLSHENPYVSGRYDDNQVIPGEELVFIGPDAEEITPDEARERAYELLVLADLAELLSHNGGDR